MSGLKLTDQEKAAFCQDIDRNRALEYYYSFDNVPQHFVYHDDIIPGELTEMEARNKILSETLWAEGYNRYFVCNVSAQYTCSSMLQANMPTHEVFTIYITGGGQLEPSEVDNHAGYRTLEEMVDGFDAWMKHTGRSFLDKERWSPPIASWRSQLVAPDRTHRVVSTLPAGNDLLMEWITSWSEDGILRETAWVEVLNFHADGSVLLDRLYANPGNWPGAGAYKDEISGTDQDQSKGAMDRFYDCHKPYQIAAETTEIEKRNLSIVEGAWIDAQNTGPDPKVFHPERFRMQWPNQKCSFNLDILKEVEAIAREKAPDKKIHLGMTYAKGNQVAAEGYVSWAENGVEKEAGFISFLLLDADGLIIRERRYFTWVNWPAENQVMTRLGM